MSRKVLVVDDEKLIVKGIRFSLEQDGMEVDCAYDGEEAVEKAKDKKYDIILLDLMLPKMDGLEVCQQIREFSNVPIVMLTAKGEDMVLNMVRMIISPNRSISWKLRHVSKRSCAVREATTRRKKRQRAFRWAIFVWTVKADVYLLQVKRLI